MDDQDGMAHPGPMSVNVVCDKCGNPIDPNSRYCVFCGRAKTGSASTTVVTPVAGSVPPPSTALPTRDGLFELLVQTTLGDYDIAGELGRGGMARVFLAHDIGLDRDVAIKVMHPALVTGEGMVERFKREARTAAAVSHPNIIPIYHVKETENLLYFVMKYVRGRSLESIIQDEGPMPVKMIENIVTQVGQALLYAHRKNIVHRDIKPGNIMLDEDGRAVVTDFGIVKVSEADSLTMTGSAIGTPYYMSPEQCSAQPVTGASDQYSLGVVAYEMLTGKPPFPGPTVMEVMRAHFFDPPKPIRQLRPDCPPHLERAVMRMLEKDPQARWPDLHEAVVHIGAPPARGERPGQKPDDRAGAKRGSPSPASQG